MPVSYNQFLNGRRSTGTLARQWDSQHNNNQRFGGAPARRAGNPQPYTATDNSPAAAYASTGAPELTFDINGPLDATGETQRTNLDARNRQAEADIQTDFDTTNQRLESRRPLLEYDRDQGYEGADSNAAARGIMKSGIRTQNRAKVFRGYSQGVQQLESDLADNATTRRRRLSTQQGEYQDQSTQIKIDAAQRRLDNQRRQYGGL